MISKPVKTRERHPLACNTCGPTYRRGDEPVLTQHKEQRPISVMGQLWTENPKEKTNLTFILISELIEKKTPKTDEEP